MKKNFILLLMIIMVLGGCSKKQVVTDCIFEEKSLVITSENDVVLKATETFYQEVPFGATWEEIEPQIETSFIDYKDISGFSYEALLEEEKIKVILNYDYSKMTPEELSYFAVGEEGFDSISLEITLESLQEMNFVCTTR